MPLFCHLSRAYTLSRKFFINKWLLWVIWPCSIRDSFPLGPFRTILTFNIIHEIDQIAHDKESVQFFRFKGSPYLSAQYPIVIFWRKTTEFMLQCFRGQKWLVSHVPKWKYVLSSYFEINEFLRMSLIKRRRCIAFYGRINNQPNHKLYFIFNSEYFQNQRQI